MSRYLVPWIPFVVFFALVGANALGGVLQERRGGALAVAVLSVAILLFYARTYARTDFGPPADGPTSATAKELWTFIRNQTSAEAVFVFAKPRALSLFTGRPASSYFEPRDKRELWAYMREIRARYLMVGPRDLYLWQFVGDYPDQMTRVFSSGSYAVYRLDS